MPVYVYKNKETGERIDRSYGMQDNIPEKIQYKGATYIRDYHAESAKTPPPANWPMVSEAMGVHPDQVDEANKAALKLGLGVPYRKDGMAILEDRSHRKRMMKSFQIHDNDGGYGDG